FLELPERIAGGGEVEVLGELLGDRARSADPLAALPEACQRLGQLGPVLHIGPAKAVPAIPDGIPDRRVVDSAVLVEPVILSDERRGPHRRWDAGQRHRVVAPRRRRDGAAAGILRTGLLVAAERHEGGFPRPRPAVPHRRRPDEPEPRDEEGRSRQKDPAEPAERPPALADLGLVSGRKAHGAWRRTSFASAPGSAGRWRPRSP